MQIEGGVIRHRDWKPRSNFSVLTWSWKDFASSGNPKEQKKDTTSGTVQSDASGGKLFFDFSFSFLSDWMTTEEDTTHAPVEPKKEKKKNFPFKSP